MYKFYAIFYILRNGDQNISKTSLANVEEKEKPKKYKHETMFEESFKAKVREKVECEYIEREKYLQQRQYKVGQREHKDDQKDHDFALKQI